MSKITPIIMLTHNDVTVPNAFELFNECKDLPLENWGFKDVGMTEEKAIQLGLKMKEAGKLASYEIVDFNEASYKKAARIALEGQFAYVACGDFNQELADILKDNNIGYMPTCGRLIHDPEPDGPCVMVSDKDELIQLADYGLSHGVTGFDCAFYRSKQYEGNELNQWLREKYPDAYLCCAGSVSSKERIKFLVDIGFNAFTTGSALFDKVHVPGGTFYDNAKYLAEYVESL